MFSLFPVSRYDNCFANSVLPTHVGPAKNKADKTHSLSQTLFTPKSDFAKAFLAFSCQTTFSLKKSSISFSRIFSDFKAISQFVFSFTNNSSSSCLKAGSISYTISQFFTASSKTSFV